MERRKTFLSLRPCLKRRETPKAELFDTRGRRETNPFTPPCPKRRETTRAHNLLLLPSELRPTTLELHSCDRTQPMATTQHNHRHDCGDLSEVTPTLLLVPRALCFLPRERTRSLPQHTASGQSGSQAVLRSPYLAKTHAPCFLTPGTRCPSHNSNHQTTALETCIIRPETQGKHRIFSC